VTSVTTGVCRHGTARRVGEAGDWPTTGEADRPETVKPQIHYVGALKRLEVNAVFQAESGIQYHPSR
jgi:hypothetical protein